MKFTERKGDSSIWVLHSSFSFPCSPLFFPSSASLEPPQFLNLAKRNSKFRPTIARTNSTSRPPFLSTQRADRTSPSSETGSLETNVVLYCLVPIRTRPVGSQRVVSSNWNFLSLLHFRRLVICYPTDKKFSIQVTSSLVLRTNPD